MKQPTIEIKSKHESFGIKKITKLIWDQAGNLSMIKVEFGGDALEDMAMYDYDGKGIFKNVHGNLFGTIIYNS